MEEHESTIYVSHNLQKNIARSAEEAGYIAGLEVSGTTYCLAAAASTGFFLPGLEVVGIFCKIKAETLSENELLDRCNLQIDKLKVELDNALVLFVNESNTEEDTIEVTGKLFSTYHHSFSALTVRELNQNPTLLLRAQGKLPLLFEVSPDPETLKENIELAMERIRSIIHSEVATFLLCCTDPDSRQAPMISNSNVTNQELLKFIQFSDLVDKIRKQRKNKRKTPVHFDILIQTSGDVALQNTVNHSLVIHCQRREFQCVSTSLPLDVLIVCLETSTVSDIYKLFNGAIQTQLESMTECLLAHAKNAQFVCPVPHHFYPEIWDLPVTVIYPSNKTDAELATVRRELHKLLLLSLDRPFLRKLNLCSFSNAMSSGCLLNPHEGLPPSGVKDGRVSLVYGRYAYHHYMQDLMNDNGWGCAYRSLQTIVSWFKLQGYTDKNVPTHKEIQKALVDIGDKPEKFIGSRQWIGSQEVSFCLDQLIQVQSKILCVTTGAEMANKGRELSMHFQRQGTPIMIGGGVLAHTILGVDFNQNTGDLKFLILDPHYTGGEDLHVIQSKGWCGWKGVQFWDQNAFYNLCLPQRPEEI